MAIAPDSSLSSKINPRRSAKRSEDSDITHMSEVKLIGGLDLEQVAKSHKYLIYGQALVKNTLAVE